MNRRSTWQETPAGTSTAGEVRDTQSAVSRPRQQRSKLRAADVFRLGTSGLRSRPTRAILSALGIAIGIAAMISVVGISSSSQAKLNQQLAALGTNMLTATAGKTFLGEGSKLPEETVAKLRRMEGVESASSIATLPDLSIYRNSQIDPNRTAGLEVAVADQKLLSVTGAKIAQGAWMNNATASFPTVVLGATAAQRLGVVTPGSQVWLGNQYFTVIGILDPVDLLPELDTMAFMGDAAARAHTAYKGNPTSVFVRADEDSVTEVRSELPRNVSPQAPETVDVSRPSDALAAKNASDEAFTGLLVGLGSIALLVGGIGVANTMVISVLERRREVGLRRALGATRAHIRVQFLTEALLLSGLGGVFGAVLGAGVTTVFAISSGWPVVLPLEAVLFGIGATLVIGAAAGLYPAVRAARTPPTVALSS